ncbi:MAG: restriction endonuclease [Candidatus Heimdallarchaeota archaeon]|nr:restriction endonuclease [Candidatus Heimdallarchaeota archaeon]
MKETISDVPSLVAEFNPKNDFKASDIPVNFRGKIWWICAYGHEWEGYVKNRMRGSGCPYCSGRYITPDNSLAQKFPDKVKFWDYTKNDTSPEKVAPKSNTKYHWKCPKGPDHEWPATPNNQTKANYGCPFCSGHRVSVTNSLATLYPELVKEWHPSFNDKSPAEYTAGSSKKVWWKCEIHEEHVWPSKIVHRTKGSNCPYCANKKVSVTNSLATMYPSIAAEWHPKENGNLTPHDVIPGSDKKYVFRCELKHTWESRLMDRTKKNTDCPKCKRIIRKKIPWNELNGEQFEIYITKLLLRMGFKKVHNRKVSGDGGIDIEVIEQGKLSDVKIGIECKNWPKRKIKPSTVQVLDSAIRSEKFDKGIIISTNFFSSGVIKKANELNIALIDIYRLNELIDKYQITA